MNRDFGLDLTRQDAVELVVLTRTLHDLVREAIASKSVGFLMDYLYMDMAATAERQPPMQLACRAGCAHCCHGWVAATAPEVFYLAKAIAPERRTQTAARVAGIATQTASKSFAAREKMLSACPLLEDNLCSTYRVRPIACRTGVSFDAAACERAHIQLSGEWILRPNTYIAMRHAYHVALAVALKQAGLKHRAYEYNGALNAALSAPDAEARWLAGADVFEGLPLDEGPDPLGDPNVQAMARAAFG